MKNLLILLTLSFYSNLTTNAQVFNPGIIAGFSFSQVDGDNFISSNVFDGYNKFGLIAGGCINTKVSKNSLIQMEIYYIKKGSFNIVNSNTISYKRFDLTLNYIEIPTLIRFSSGKLINVDKLMFEVGLYFARFLNYSVKNEFGKVNRQFYQTFNENPFNKEDLGFLIGIHYQLSKHLALNYRFKRSIIPIRIIRDSNRSQKWYNRGMNLTLRYQLYK